MIPLVITKTLAASSANNLATSQTPGSGTPLTLTALAGTGLDTQRRVLLTFGSEASNRTMVITGKNSQGTVISETLSIASGAGSTVATVQDFLTVSQALPLGGGWTAAVTLGTNTTGSTMWQVVNYHSPTFQIGFELELTSGSGTASVEATRDVPTAPIQIYTAGMGIVPPICDPFPLPQLNNQTADAFAAIDDPFTAFRVTVTAGTGLWTCSAVQSGFRS